MSFHGRVKHAAMHAQRQRTQQRLAESAIGLLLGIIAMATGLLLIVAVLRPNGGGRTWGLVGAIVFFRAIMDALFEVGYQTVGTM